MNKILTFDVSDLLKASQGNSLNYTFEDDETKGKIEIMKIEDGFNVIVTDFETEGETHCSRCLKKIKRDVKFEHAERQYYLEKPDHIDDINDVFLVDMKNANIDISEMIRQEIILHFPENSVCSSSCQGICQICGKDRNKAKCDCKAEEITANKPLAQLKDLIKQQKNA